MAREQGTTEDTVREIIESGIDFRPREIRTVSVGEHVIKPYNFDGEWLVDGNNLSANPTIEEHITVDIGTTGTQFTHHLDRTITGKIVCDQDAEANIALTSSTKATVTLTASAAVNARVIIF